ncbi:MAG: chromosome segregation protein SMC [Pseudomonadota bacterium]|nr:chromosome segregation protein SMC [Pseudomonadota bacterium]
MRLNHVKLAGFKSFVDPTSIGTPGQLVGIVGPNGCGKSNVIDAVRWVLGESKASALRGDSMQDVIFNGAGGRKPVGRASVELHFTNHEGRIGGQWGQYAEISIKRVLSRDGDSSYYINNIPVRRRDIHDLFLGTGLGPRAYAIIEQGMISRVIEAKPEELRVFLEEAAGVSKYKERRKETEGRLADTRDNLSRVEDIRAELGSQLDKLEAQGKVALEYRELEGKLKETQHLLWFSKQQDALRSRERHSSEIAALTVALESLHADVRAVETRLEHLRTDHYAAGDALHQRQGEFYAATAEVTRLEQQLQFARESESRLAHQLAQITEQMGALDGQASALGVDRAEAEAALEKALAARAQSSTEEEAATAALPPLEEVVRRAAVGASELQQKIALAQQSIRVLETRFEHQKRTSDQLAQRRERMEAERNALQAPVTTLIADVQQQLDDEQNELASKETAVAALRASLTDLQEQRRTAGEATQHAQRALADLEARMQALSALQAKIGRSKDRGEWLREHALADGARLFSALDIDPAWNDALEAVLRERLEAIELPSLARSLEWGGAGAPLPGRLAVYEHGDAPTEVEGAADAAQGGDTLLSKVQTSRAEIARLLADWLRGVRCVEGLHEAVTRRRDLHVGESFVTRDGHLVSAQGISFFAPDTELHGVLARQRELAEMSDALTGVRERAATTRQSEAAVEHALDAAQKSYHAESIAFSSQQRRCHDLELELMQMRQAAEAAERRRAQLTKDIGDIDAQQATEREQAAAVRVELADAQSALHDQLAEQENGRGARNEAEVALARGRERLRVAERASQEGGFAERRARDRIAELERRHAALESQRAQLQQMLAQLTSEQQAIDWSPVEEALHRQLALRGEAEQALAAARDRVEGLAAELRIAEEARLTAEQRVDPARSRIEEMRLREQAALILEQQYTEQLTQAQADLVQLPEAIKAFGPKSGLAPEIERLQKAIEDLGAVNLAALEELGLARERKEYLDAQSLDLTEAMSTLENAIRQIDRESRQLLQQTFDIVDENFSKLFPALFGGGQAKLVLTGEEILDSGVQVVAQPPGKRNTSIHLLSGGEKALTAISLVFALFQLNPAPFCLLDEVDAPLDDPNTERFCKMVREMSAHTQFLFISHNKITMEMASQLVGITMPEPGISRVVQVDIAEALELAETGAA